jgi:hypothetical protein
MITAHEDPPKVFTAVKALGRDRGELLIDVVPFPDEAFWSGAALT